MKHKNVEDAPDLESIAVACIQRFKRLFELDDKGERFETVLAVEEEIAGFFRELGRRVIQSYADVRYAQSTKIRGFCECEKGVTVHKKTEWTRKTPLGPVNIRDPAMRCRRCAASARTLHALIGTSREVYSLDVVEKALDLASDESAGEAVKKLARHHPGVEMDRNTALRFLHAYGQNARRFVDNKLGHARKLTELPRIQRGPGISELEVEYDGGMIPVATLEPIAVEEGQKPELTAVRKLPKRKRNCYWRETVIGLAQKPGSIDRLYAARLSGQTDAAFDDLFGLAAMKGWTEETHVRGLADGAIYIRPRMEEAFNMGDFRFVLDRPHCKEHLSDAGAALSNLSGVPAQEWAGQALRKMEHGDAMSVVNELKEAYLASGADEKSRNDVLRREAAYFKRNADAVAYAEYRDNGWSTASSEVESAHRSVVQSRLKIPGAWWHPDHVDDILALRILKANHWWDEFWAHEHAQWYCRAKARKQAFADRLNAV